MPMKYLIILLIFHISFGIGQTIQLNEIVSSNGDNLYDEDGDTPDWIEIYNPGPEVLNISGFGLSHDTEDFHKWIFPDMNINPKDLKALLWAGEAAVSLEDFEEADIHLKRLEKLCGDCAEQQTLLSKIEDASPQDQDETEKNKPEQSEE